MSGRLPKLQLPADEATRRRIAEASELARDGEIKGSQQALKELVAGGALPPAQQRQVLAWWSAGEYDLPGCGTAATEAGGEASSGAGQAGGAAGSAVAPLAKP